MARPGAQYAADKNMSGHYGARYETFGMLTAAMRPIWARLAGARGTA
jgi:hypothetical protein